MTAKLKAAKRGVEAFLSQKGVQLSHSEYLELIARAHMFKDWNTAQALTKEPQPISNTNTSSGKLPVWLGYPSGIEYFLTLTIEGVTETFISQWKSRISQWSKDVPVKPHIEWFEMDGKICQHWSGLGEANNILLALVNQQMWLTSQKEIRIVHSTLDRISRSTETMQR